MYAVEHVLVFIGLMYDTYLRLSIMLFVTHIFQLRASFSFSLPPQQTLSMSMATTLQVIGPSFTAPKIASIR
jgi:hypothetical protein